MYNTIPTEEELTVRRHLGALKIDVPEGQPLERAFRDGALLCRVVELLEGIDLEGVQRKPRAQPHMLLNHNKALNVLRRNPLAFAKLYRVSAHDLVRAAPGSVTSLLSSIFVAYRKEYDRAVKIIRERKLVQNDMTLKFGKK